MTYTAPVAGWYRVSTKMIKYEPTGQMTMRKNWKHRWWKFWEPKETLHLNTEWLKRWME